MQLEIKVTCKTQLRAKNKKSKIKSINKNTASVLAKECKSLLLWQLKVQSQVHYYCKCSLQLSFTSAEAHVNDKFKNGFQLDGNGLNLKPLVFESGWVIILVLWLLCLRCKVSIKHGVHTRPHSFQTRSNQVKTVDRVGRSRRSEYGDERGCHHDRRTKIFISNLFNF